MHPWRERERGFTLIEVMITVAVVAILAAVAVPSYQESVRRGRRVEAQSLLTEAAARQERYRAQNGSYLSGDVNKLKLANGNKSEGGHYTLSVGAVAGDGGYTLKAQRSGAQTADTKCGDFTLTATGRKGMAANTPGTAADCWR